MLRHLKSVLSATGRFSRRAWLSNRIPVVAAGLALGGGSWIVVQTFFATLGFMHETSAALLVAVAVALPAGQIIARRFPALPGTGLAGIFAAGWLVLLPSIMNLALRALDGLPPSFLVESGTRLVCLAGAALFVAGPPTVCCAIISQNRSSREQGATWLVGLASGVLLAALLAGPFFGLVIPAFTIAIGTGLVWIGRQFAPGDLTVEEGPSLEGPRVSTPRRITAGIALAATGVIAGVLGRVLVQLMPEAPQLLAGGGAAVLLGMAGGIAYGRRGHGENSPLVGALIVACCGLLPLAAFGGLISFQMHANAYVSAVALLMAIRMVIVAACFFPLGIGFALLGHSSRGGSGAGIGRMALLCMGLAVSPWLIAAWGVTSLALIIAVTIVLMSLPWLRLPAARRWQLGVGVAMAGCLLIGMGVNVGRYAPSRATRLLFDASTLLSWKQGVPRRLLTVLNDTRLISQRETTDGTLTAWRSRGTAISLRLDGIPLSLTTENVGVCPLPASEVLRVLLPVVLHDDPESLLLLSDPAGVGATISTEFPLRQITCHDEIAFGPEGQAILPDLSRDERLECRSLSPRLALLIEDRSYDVIVSAPGHPAAFGNAAYFTTGFYKSAAGRLSAGGIFCQRVRFADFGPGPLRVMGRTMREAFDRVMAVELGGGEIALLGTVGDATFFREGLVERLQRPQVCRVLAKLGWDWSMPFNLKAIPAEPFATFADGSSGINTAMSGRLGHRLPWDMLRWGPKAAELQAATAEMTGSLVSLAAPADERDEILARISAVARQHEMMTRYPDQPWAYRKAVRQHLDETPRTMIKKVDGNLERVLHPEEKRRLDYFAALSEAIRKLDEPSLAALEAFAEPYDPLITYFLHHEIAPLYAQLGPEGRTRELAHRLHAAYFADARDRSIRNIVESINLLAEHPDVIPDPARRYDQLNSLLELLLIRWETRGGGIPQSPEVALVDIDKSLDALVKALPVMEELASQIGVSAEEWSRRDDAIERMLSRPLREYRTNLLPHRHARKGEG